MNLQKKDQFLCDKGICGQKTKYKENQKLGICKRKYQKGRKQMKVTTGVPDKLDPVKQKEAAEESEEKRLKVMAMLENDHYLYENIVYCYLMKKRENQKLGICKRKYQKVCKQMKVTTGVPDKLDPVKQKEAAEESEEKLLKVRAKLENDAYLYQYIVYCYLMERGEMEAAEESEEKRLQVKAMLESDQNLYDNIVYSYLMKKREIFILQENGDIYRQERDMLSLLAS